MKSLVTENRDGSIFGLEETKNRTVPIFSKSRGARRERRGVALFLEITKARLVSLVLWSVAVGFILGSGRSLDFLLLLKTLGGTALVAAGAMALNQYLERDQDAKMKRTENRPLPSEQIGARAVLLFGIFVSLTGLGILGAGVNQLVELLSGIALLSYLFIYTPLKTKTPLCTFAGAIPGALPPVLGWAAARGELSLEAWVLFMILFVWQVPHVLAISWVWREDFARAGFRMFAVLDPTGSQVADQIFRYTLALVPVSLLPTFAQLTGFFYLVGALLLGIWFVHSSLRTRAMLEVRAKPFFRDSIVYLSLLFLLMLLDRTSS